MKNEIFIGRNSSILNFSSKYCDSSEAILSSKAFKLVLNKYILSIKEKNTIVYQYLNNCSKNSIEEDLIKLFKLLIILDKKEIIKLDETLSNYLKK